MAEAPQAFDVKLIESNERPCGLGEPATPTAAPALANAIFAATGKRFHHLPLLGSTGNKLDLG
jgi:isoquinoline 1-oxidoreductase beta subunit